MNKKRQMPLHYLRPEAEELRPMFSYLLVADDSVNGRLKIKVFNLKDVAEPRAFKKLTITIVTNNPEEAFLGAIAQLNSHHDGLKAIFDLSEIDKDRSMTSIE